MLNDEREAINSMAFIFAFILCILSIPVYVFLICRV
jgi:hypothetical protein